jgi:hypothetical protein
MEALFYFFNSTPRMRLPACLPHITAPPRPSHLRVHVRAVHVDAAAVVVDDLAQLGE